MLFSKSGNGLNGYPTNFRIFYFPSTAAPTEHYTCVSTTVVVDSPVDTTVLVAEKGLKRW